MGSSRAIVIIGGGTSLKPVIADGLWASLSGVFTIGCNMIYLYWHPTIVTFIDPEAWTTYFTQARKVRRMVAHPNCAHAPETNIIPIPATPDKREYAGRDGIRGKRLYSPWLTGVYATSLAVCFDPTHIYWLGFDGYSGSGPCEYYGSRLAPMSAKKRAWNAENIRALDVLSPFRAEDKVQFVNVGRGTEMDTQDSPWPTIPYEEFLARARSGEFISNPDPRNVDARLRGGHDGYRW